MALNSMTKLLCGLLINLHVASAQSTDGTCADDNDLTGLLQTTVHADNGMTARGQKRSSADKCTWTKAVKGGITGMNIFWIKGETMDSCKAKCNGNPACKSMDFRSRDGGCATNTCQAGDGTCTLDTSNSEYQYSACVEGRCKWAPMVKGSIAGHNLKGVFLTGETMDSCKGKCNKDVACKSVDFRKSDGGCGLNNCEVGDGKCVNEDPNSATYEYSQCVKAPAYANKLVYLGKDDTGILGKCEGDCDNDSDCITGLKCFQRTGALCQVPGCTGSCNSDQTDYCISK